VILLTKGLSVDVFRLTIKLKLHRESGYIIAHTEYTARSNSGLEPRKNDPLPLLRPFQVNDAALMFG